MVVDMDYEIYHYAICRRDSMDMNIIEVGLRLHWNAPNHNPPLCVGGEKEVDTPLLMRSYVRPWKAAIVDRIAGTILKSQNAQWRKQ